jgi:hypothetical protein
MTGSPWRAKLRLVKNFKNRPTLDFSLSSGAGVSVRMNRCMVASFEI